MAKKLRYIEISRRNPRTRMFVGAGNTCNPYQGGSCAGEICIVIEKAGQQNCAPKVQYDACGDACAPPCDIFLAKICATEVDDYGYAVFDWPRWLMVEKEGWYTGTVVNGCSTCAVLPLRIGPRCNVIEVETEISGPDSACVVTCGDEPCKTDICPPHGREDGRTPYTPNYTISFHEEEDHETVGLIGGRRPSLMTGKPDAP